MYRLIVAALAAGTLAAAIHYGTYSAGAADQFGYVSEADLFATGRVRYEQQFVRTMPWPHADLTFAPHGYRPAREWGFIVPVYAPGLPIVMAGFQKVWGRDAVFYAVPLLAALCVWFTADIGTRLHSRVAGAMAAALVATSPIFLFQAIQPMSDVPAAAWWTIAVALALRETPAASLGSGLAAGMAVLTRPNLVSLGVVIGAYLLFGSKSRRLANALSFSAGTLPGGLTLAAIYNALNGSPFQHGYVPLDTIFSWRHVLPNLLNYPLWLVQTQTPFILLAMAAPWLLGRAVPRRHLALLLTLAVVVFVSYLGYVAFGRDEWGYLRYLLPALPGLLVLACAAALEAWRRVTAGRRQPAFAAVLTVALGAWQIQDAAARGYLGMADFERRFPDVGRYIAAVLPREAVFISGLHAGSIRYYSGRTTVLHDWLAPRWLDPAIDALRARGFRPYIVLEEGEEPSFQARFGALNAFGRLDWPPMAQRAEPIRVRIYDPEDRRRHLAGEPVSTRIIPVGMKGHIPEP